MSNFTAEQWEAMSREERQEEILIMMGQIMKRRDIPYTRQLLIKTALTFVAKHPDDPGLFEPFVDKEKE